LVKGSPADVRVLLGEVTDPEIPVLTIEDLGILRDVRVIGERVEVDITPTYSGCPALDTIRADIEAALRRQGWGDVTVTTVLAPAWTSDWMSTEGRRKLHEYGIAPPGPVRPIGVRSLPMAIRCPQCGSSRTEELSRFSSTACKSLHRCRDCLEPFDYFKPH
jgi:ring-1,2-phenylacetyl-CoA epoxidase subunit PaaD